MDFSDLLSALFGMVKAAVQTLIFCFYISFKEPRGKPNKLLVFLFSALNCAAVIIPAPLYIALPLSIISTILLLRFGFGENRRGATLYGVLSSGILWLSFGSVNALFSVLGAVTHIPDTPAGGLLFQISSNALSLCAYWMISRASFKVIRNERAGVQNALTITIPLVLILIVEVYIVKAIYPTADTSRIRKGDIELFAVQLLGIASVFCVLLLYKKCAENLRMREKMLLYERERHYGGQYALDIKTCYSTARSMWHDLKNHMLIVGEMLQKERYRDASGYISKLNKTCSSSELKFHTGSFVLDIILTEKLTPLIDKVTVKITAVPDIEETDICAIFGNAVDNAVNAVSKLPDNERFIAISTRKKGEMLLVEFENSFDGKPFESSTGIGNIAAAAEKYGGAIKILTDEDRFVLKIILCDSQH